MYGPSEQKMNFNLQQLTKEDHKRETPYFNSNRAFCKESVKPENSCGVFQLINYVNNVKIYSETYERHCHTKDLLQKVYYSYGNSNVLVLFTSAWRNPPVSLPMIPSLMPSLVKQLSVVNVIMYQFNVYLMAFFIPNFPLA